MPVSVTSETQPAKKGDTFKLGKDIFSYKGATTATAAQPRAEFKNENTGEPISILVTKQGDLTWGVMRYLGSNYKFINASSSLLQDYYLNIDLNGNGIIGT